jgi:hypothetical protein
MHAKRLSIDTLLSRKNGRVIRRVPGENPTVGDILDFLPDLNIQGFRCWGRLSDISNEKHRELRAELLNPDALGGLSLATTEQVRGWLTSFVPSRRWKQLSYGLKHTFERETGTYMMDGAFIVCVLMAGFEIKIAGPSALIKMQRPAR